MPLTHSKPEEPSVGTVHVLPVPPHAAHPPSLQLVQSTEEEELREEEALEDGEEEEGEEEEEAEDGEEKEDDAEDTDEEKATEELRGPLLLDTMITALEIAAEEGGAVAMHTHEPPPLRFGC